MKTLELAKQRRKTILLNKQESLKLEKEVKQVIKLDIIQKHQIIAEVTKWEKKEKRKEIEHEAYVRRQEQIKRE